MGSRILFDRRPIGVTLGNLTPPKAARVAVPVVAGANVGNAPQSHLSPLPANSRVGSADGYRGWIMARQRRAAAMKSFSTH